MAVRVDKIQLNVEFITDESRQLAKTNISMKELNKELAKTVREGGDVADVMRRIAAEGGKIENLDFTKVTKDQLITLSRQLETSRSKIASNTKEYGLLTGQLKRVNDRLATVRQESRGVADAMEVEQNGGVLGVLKRVQLGALAFIAVFAGIVSGFRNLVAATSLFQRFGAVLSRELGGSSAAQKAIREVTALADELRKPADALVESYTKLVTRGIKPSTEELRNLVDLAASQGKEVDQLTEALLDAGTLEFERLKEFGIRAKQSGDQVSLSFKGQTVEVAKNQDAILKAILGFGQLQGVQGAAADSAANLTGKVDRLTGFFDRLLANLGQGGLGQAIGSLIDNASDLVSVFVDLTDIQQGLTTETRATQAAFNLEIETLKRGNLSAETRAKLIDSINTKYGEYLPNLLSESSTLGDIAKAQEMVNRQFEQKIILLAAEEKLTEVSKRRLEAKSQELELELKLTAARERTFTAGARARQNSFSSTQQFAGVGVAASSVGERTSNTLAAEALERLNANKEEQIKLEKEFQATLKAAEGLGLDIDSILNPPSSGIGGGKKDPVKVTLDDRLKAIQELTAQRNALAERAFIAEELTEKQYNARLSTIREEDFRAQLEAYAAFGKSQVSEAEELQNELLSLERRRAEAPTLVVSALAPREDAPAVERRGVDAGLEALAEEEARQAENIQALKNQQLISEEQFGLAKLNLRRDVLTQEIEILRQGTAEEVALANQKATQIGAIDQQIFDQKAVLAERERQLRADVEEAKAELFSSGLDTVSELLGRDEAARKKNAGAIKTFEIGRALIAGQQEIQQINLAAAAQSAINPLGAPFILAAAKIRSITTAIRTAVAVGKIAATKFARGGTAKFGQFGGRSHAAGGTKGYFEDGTQVEVEAGETFAVVNKRARGVLSYLSAANQASGGVSFFARGGIVASPSTTPIIGPDTAAATVGAGQDAAQLQSGMEELRRTAEALRYIQASVVLTDIESAQTSLNQARSAANA